LLKKRVEIERAVDKAMQKELNVSDIKQTSLNGLQLINREVLIHYLRQLLTIDLELAPFSIIGLETDVKGAFQTPHISTTIGGRIDRLDRIVKDGQERIRVIDYKTGSRAVKPLADVDAIFSQDNIANHSDYYLQTFLYASLVKQKYPDIPVSPALLFIQHSGGNNYDPTLRFGKEPITDVAPSFPRFMELLRTTIDDMFNPSVPYQPTADTDRCATCPYKLLCS
jgi:ATP-dependent exoDNAse (exonuclease V) beta subunit